MKKIYVGCDHAGIELKKILLENLSASGFIADDRGCFEGESVDYPDYARLVCEAVLQTPDTCGILICGTGIGISIAANKFHGIRAALCHSEFDAKMSRNHNNANVICFGARTTTADLATKMVHSFLSSAFEGGRHQRRLDKISEIERNFGHNA